MTRVKSGKKKKDMQRTYFKILSDYLSVPEVERRVDEVDVVGRVISYVVKVYGRIA